MPLTLTLTEGILPVGKEKEAVAQITDAMLKWHGLTGSAIMKRNITATVHVLKKNSTFSGGEEFSGVWVEWKVPSFAFSTREVQIGFASDTVKIIQDLSVGKHPAENIYINVLHAVDGIWNFEGKPLANAEIAEALK
jgi:hypothetical protein